MDWSTACLWAVNAERAVVSWLAGEGGGAAGGGAAARGWAPDASSGNSRRRCPGTSVTLHHPPPSPPRPLPNAVTPQSRHRPTCSRVPVGRAGGGERATSGCLGSALQDQAATISGLEAAVKRAEAAAAARAADAQREAEAAAAARDRAAAAERLRDEGMAAARKAHRSEVHRAPPRRPRCQPCSNTKPERAFTAELLLRDTASGGAPGCAGKERTAEDSGAAPHAGGGHPSLIAG